MALSAVFIAIQASVDKAHLAPAVSSLYLAQGFGCVVGLAAVSAAFQAGLRGTLETRLVQMHLDAELRDEVGQLWIPFIQTDELTPLQIIAKAVASVDYLYKARGDIAKAVTESYVDGLWYSHIVSLVASLLAFALTPLLREYKL